MNDYVYQDLMEELWARRTDASEANARIQQLLGINEQLRKERDEARRGECSWHQSPLWFANYRGWDCFKEDGKPCQ